MPPSKEVRDRLVTLKGCWHGEKVKPSFRNALILCLPCIFFLQTHQTVRESWKIGRELVRSEVRSSSAFSKEQKQWDNLSTLTPFFLFFWKKKTSGNGKTNHVPYSKKRKSFCKAKGALSCRKGESPFFFESFFDLQSTFTNKFFIS